MILLVHRKADFPVRVLKEGQELSLKSISCTIALWELAERFPEEVIGWCEESCLDQVNTGSWVDIFHHDLVMASYGFKTCFLTEDIGYVDQFPFVKVNRGVHYATWQMSADVGGIKGEVLLKFQPLFGKIKNFNFLLNSVAKIGQENSLFCYSAPGLIKKLPQEDPEPVASSKEEFSFVYSHYKRVWVFLLFWCKVKYEKKVPVTGFLTSFWQKNYFQKKVDLSSFKIQSAKKIEAADTVDVIIPTFGRPKYVYQVIKDLASQTHLPNRVIVVEQNPNLKATSELPFLRQLNWPFEICHHFIHKTGVCNARNLALNDTTADWVFFSDDDQRCKPNLIEVILKELRRFGMHGLTTSYLQKGETKIFQVPKHWGTFGSGNSIVLGKSARKAAFLPALEYGYGEDIDFGMQLRNMGCDFFYHPEIEIEHLKAPKGGFRTSTVLEWERERPAPKPSPTLMVYALRHYTPQQLRGFKVSLFIRYYNKQYDFNPFSYVREMRKRWRQSEIWADRLMERKEGNSAPVQTESHL